MTEKKNGITLRTMLIVATVSLFLAIIPIWPYGFYTFLRFLVCGVSAYFAYKISHNEKFIKHRVPLIVIAVLFNPLFPVYLFRLMWVLIDLGVGIYFLLLLRKFKRQYV
jgi:hypothetical protein